MMVFCAGEDLSIDLCRLLFVLYGRCDESSSFVGRYELAEDSHSRLAERFHSWVE
jgi:hypothetical protein